MVHRFYLLSVFNCLNVLNGSNTVFIIQFVKICHRQCYHTLLISDQEQVNVERLISISGGYSRRLRYVESLLQWLSCTMKRISLKQTILSIAFRRTFIWAYDMSHTIYPGM